MARNRIAAPAYISADEVANTLVATIAEPERVNHPAHYNQHPAGIECIDVIEHMAANVANAVKYLWRYQSKPEPLVELRKAAWYVQREIERLEKAGVK